MSDVRISEAADIRRVPDGMVRRGHQVDRETVSSGTANRQTVDSARPGIIAIDVDVPGRPQASSRD